MSIESINYFHQIKELCQIRNIDLKELYYKMELDKKVFEDLYFKRAINPIEIKKITDYFDINLSDFVSGDIDYDWVFDAKLPEKYKASEGSKFRTSLPILNYIKHQYGENVMHQLRRELKIPKQMFKNADTITNIKLLEDILETLFARGLDQNEITKLAPFVSDLKENTKVKQLCHELNGPNEMFEYLCQELTPFYDLNFNYEIQEIGEKTIKITTNALENRIEEFKTNIIDSPLVMLYRSIVATSHLRHLDIFNYSTKVLKTVHQGDEKEVFEITWH